MKIGILALQGDYEAQALCLKQFNVDVQRIRDRDALSDIDALVIPGGESSVFLTILESQQLLEPLKHFDRPILGICAGAILLAKTVQSPTQPTQQASLARLDITVERNAYGRQLDSHIHMGQWHASMSPLTIEMVFIRAPRIRINTPAVTVLATDEAEVVAVQQGHFFAASFHPELTSYSILHEYFIQCVQKNSKRLANIYTIGT